MAGGHVCGPSAQRHGAALVACFGVGASSTSSGQPSASRCFDPASAVPSLELKAMEVPM